MWCAMPNARCWWCGTRAFSVPIESERGSISCFDAFSSREPVSTSLENALGRRNRHVLFLNTSNRYLFGRALTCAAERLRFCGVPESSSGRRRRLSSEPPHFRICSSAEHRLFDVTTSQPDVAQCAIVQFPQRLDSGPALPISGQGVGPNSDSTNQSAQQLGKRRLRWALGYRGHFSSPVGFRPAKRCRWRKRCSTAAAPLSDFGPHSRSSVQSRA